MDIVGNGLARWKTMPMVRRTATGSTPAPYTSTSSRLIVPSTRVPGCTSCMRFRVRRNVLLPHPDGPMSAVMLFGSMTIETSSIALVLPYHALTPSQAIRFATAYVLSAVDAGTAGDGAGDQVEHEDEQHQCEGTGPCPVQRDLLRLAGLGEDEGRQRGLLAVERVDVDGVEVQRGQQERRGLAGDPGDGQHDAGDDARHRGREN